MKITLCLIACIIGYAAANDCSNNQPCSTDITTCAQGYTLTCRDTGSHMVCVCVRDDGNAHTCSTPDDCRQQNLHRCNHGTHWLCTNQHCHCSHGGPGGK